jgi:hypothetical protein
MYTFDELQLTEALNNGKDELLRMLEREGLLKKTAEEIGQDYALIIRKKNMLGTIIEKLFPIGEKDARVSVVKVLSV